MKAEKAKTLKEGDKIKFSGPVAVEGGLNHLFTNQKALVHKVSETGDGIHIVFQMCSATLRGIIYCRQITNLIRRQRIWIGWTHTHGGLSLNEKLGPGWRQITLREMKT